MKLSPKEIAAQIDLMWTVSMEAKIARLEKEVKP